MRVLITARPDESDLDGVALTALTVGSVRDVSASIGTWLIAQGYAQLEMRSQPEIESKHSSIRPRDHVAQERRHAKS